MRLLPFIFTIVVSLFGTWALLYFIKDAYTPFIYNLGQQYESTDS